MTNVLNNWAKEKIHLNKLTSLMDDDVLVIKNVTKVRFFIRIKKYDV